LKRNYYAYILRSRINGRHYIGSTENVKHRLLIHNSGQVKATKAYRPWEVIYEEESLTRNEAYKRELQIKKYKGGEAFKKLFIE